MKKRLFITSALMTAVMAASLATGTYAWYAASNAGGVHPTTKSTTHTAAKPQISVSTDLAITVEVTPVNTESVLHMSQVNEKDNTKYDSYYLNTLNQKVLYTRIGNAVAAKAYTVKVTIPGVDVVLSQNKASLAGVTLNIDVARITATDTQETTGFHVSDERTVVWASKYQSTNKDDDPKGSNTTQYQFTFDNDYTKIATTTEVATVYVMLDGKLKDTQKDTGDIFVDFSVTVSNASV